MARWVPKAILFDFYGTLVEDDDKTIAAITKAIAAAAPAPIAQRDVDSYWYETFSAMLARSSGKAFLTQRQIELKSLERVVDHFKAKVDAEGLVQSLYDYWGRPTILPEVRGVLGRCPVPTCIVSNIDTADLQSALRHNRLRFDRTVTSEDCRSYKPAPEMFARACALLGVASCDVLHVGDSVRADVRGAKALGIPVLWINRSGRTAPSGADRPDFASADLTGLLEIVS
jgi:2-haloacid dehalogenase/putative hydrolase of the HAD superfamily